MNLLNQLKQENQDFEWYPTTKEMTEVIGNSIHDSCSILDVGCGDGSALKEIEKTAIKKLQTDEWTPKFQLYGIEKSKPLINSLPPEIMLIGCDFHENTLIDKSFDLVFCNPPYTEYEDWVYKIMREGNFNHAFFVIPERWKNSNKIKEVLESMKLTPAVIYSGDFIESEHRQSRAKIDIIKIGSQDRIRRLRNTTFDHWFDDFMGINLIKDEKTTMSRSEEVQEEKIKQAIVENGSLGQALVKLYDEELSRLKNSYLAIKNIPDGILQEMKIRKEDLKESFKVRIDGLKNKYWNRLLDETETVTSRLTSWSRKYITKEAIIENNIDFNFKNIYAVVLWIVNNTSKYMNDQIIEIYERMITHANIELYKSNKKVFSDNNFYGKNLHNATKQEFLKEAKKIKLSNRIILDSYYGIDNRYSSFHFLKEKNKNLTESGYNLIQDLLIVAESLGFVYSKSVFNWPFQPGTPRVIYAKFPNNTEEILAVVKPFKNGNLHIKIHERLMNFLNVIFGQHQGWIHNKTEASQEMDIPLSQVNEIWDKKLKISSKEIKLLS